MLTEYLSLDRYFIFEIIILEGRLCELECYNNELSKLVLSGLRAEFQLSNNFDFGWLDLVIVFCIFLCEENQYPKDNKWPTSFKTSRIPQGTIFLFIK